MVMQWQPNVGNAMPGKRYLLDTNAIVMASAALYQATVLTNDTQLLKLGNIDTGCHARGFSIAECPAT